jgi:hypothetical protein
MSHPSEIQTASDGKQRWILQQVLTALTVSQGLRRLNGAGCLPDFPCPCSVAMTDYNLINNSGFSSPPDLSGWMPSHDRSKSTKSTSSVDSKPQVTLDNLTREISEQDRKENEGNEGK